jgi:hypothetical protein
MKPAILLPCGALVVALSGAYPLKGAESSRNVAASPPAERAHCPTMYPHNDDELDCLISAAKLPPIQRLTCTIERVSRPPKELGYTVPDWPADAHASVVIEWGELVVDIAVTGFPDREHYHHRIDPESSIIEPELRFSGIWLSWEDERSRGRSVRNKTFLTYTPGKHEWSLRIEPSSGWPRGSYGADRFSDQRYDVDFVCHEAG